MAHTDAEIMAALLRLSVADGDCIRFTGFHNERGYGTYRVDGKTHRVHRLVWTILNGPIPDGMFVCHKCDVRDCWRPSHLFLGTAKDNTQDMMSKGRGKYVNPMADKTHCKRGHEFTPENTYRQPTRPGRRCRTCQRLRNRGLLVESG